METPALTDEALARIRSADAELKAFAALRSDDDVRQVMQRLTGPLAGRWVALAAGWMLAQSLQPAAAATSN